MSAYDPQCLLLAEYFLANVVPVEGDQTRLADKLAQHIEDAIDAWVRHVRAEEPRGDAP
jgi:hypothetical protein